MNTPNPKQLLLAAVVGLALLPASTCVAEQGGTGHYVSGQTTDFSGLAPTQPGWVFANYFLNYNDATYSAAKGLPYGSLIGLDVTANSSAEVPTLIYAYPFDFLGGTLSSGISVPIQWTTIKVGATLNTPRQQFAGSAEQSTSGLGDIELMPVMAAWTNGDFSINGMFNVWAPTGSYDLSQLANNGLGYWTFEPMVAASWISSKIGTEVSLFAGVDFNTENTAANYQSGSIFHVDATVAQHLPLFGGLAGVGASAFWLKQITGDSGSGARLGSFMAETYGVGPTISYVHPIGKTTLVADASWLPQLNSVNTTKGDYFWVRITLAF
jgi:hypothetical protein